jgi:hypothetical protein
MNIKRSRADILDVFEVLKSLRLMKTFNAFGQNNLAIFNSLNQIGTHPPLIVNPQKAGLSNLT